MVTIGNVQLNARVVLGPMAGVTDFAFRAVCRAQGAALTTTEMVSAKALVYKDEKTKALLPIPPTKPLMLNMLQTDNIKIYKQEQEVFKSFKALHNNSVQ